ncbi:hypothetical protein [Methanobrevibacter sp.]|uniref:hypothetical protein n=1 Tax=Methanobrevibacter sp. TaxID=66852 RepID=UPI002E7AAD77|nr:hypothetical protein [Methanobrevibacter sp.]MEE1335596.1 hypothetical protein [Methanobrevibacter sp.]
MSSRGVIDLKRDIVSARIDGMLCRAEKKGMEAGMEAGRDEGKLEIARNMLDNGFAIEDIIDVTGLSEKDIFNDG